MNRESIIRLSWYIIIGILTYFLNNFLLFTFRASGKFSDTVSVAFSFLITSLCHFILHNAITFRKSRRKFGAKFIGHVAVTVLNYFAGVITAALTLRFVCDNNWLATAFSTAVTFILGYSLFNRFVYRTAIAK